MKPDETRPDAIRPDKTRPDAIRPDETRPDAIRPDETNPDAIRPDETRPDAIRPDKTSDAQATVWNKSIQLFLSSTSSGCGSWTPAEGTTFRGHLSVVLFRPLFLCGPVCEYVPALPLVRFGV